MCGADLIIEVDLDVVDISQSIFIMERSALLLDYALTKEEG